MTIDKNTDHKRAGFVKLVGRLVTGGALVASLGAIALPDAAEAWTDWGGWRVAGSADYSPNCSVVWGYGTATGYVRVASNDPKKLAVWPAQSCEDVRVQARAFPSMTTVTTTWSSNGTSATGSSPVNIGWVQCRIEAKACLE